jgi:hypothetical protein
VRTPTPGLLWSPPQAKLKTPGQLQELLDITRELLTVSGFRSCRHAPTLPNSMTCIKGWEQKLGCILC